MTIEKPQPQANPMLHLVAPIVAIGATMIVRKMMNSGYRRVTGSPAPDVNEPGVTFTRALVWAVATAATAAAVEVAVYRFTSPAGRTD
jgi:hypothetical protein